MKYLRRFIKVWKLVRDGDIVYTTYFTNKCIVRIPGCFEGNIIAEPGTTLTVYMSKDRSCY